MKLKVRHAYHTGNPRPVAPMWSNTSKTLEVQHVNLFLSYPASVDAEVEAWTQEINTLKETLVQHSPICAYVKRSELSEYDHIFLFF